MPKDERPPAFLLYVDDFTSDGLVEVMTTEQVGAYFLLLCKAWREDPPGSIPNNDHVLARWARLDPNRWAECRTGVLAAFSLGTDDRWHQKRMRKEFAKLTQRIKDKSTSASRAAKARWMHAHSQRIADAMPDDANALDLNCIENELVIPESLRTEKFVEVWETWVKRRKKKKWSVDPECLNRQLKELTPLGPEGAARCVNESIKNGWQGIFPGKRNGSDAVSQRTGPGQRYRPPS